jgi:hypothetical protein
MAWTEAWGEGAENWDKSPAFVKSL